MDTSSDGLADAGAGRTTPASLGAAAGARGEDVAAARGRGRWLSRARSTTQLHIDGRDVPVAVQAQRSELAPHDVRPRPQRADVLARAVERMKVRDDEDLAVTQLPARPGRGRVDDPDLHPSADLGPERAAIDAEPRSTPVPSRAQLHALRAELDQLRADHAACRCANSVS
jgi:hypothetical protein